jgi:hypothetical protein
LTSIAGIHPSSDITGFEVYGISGNLLYKQAIYSGDAAAIPLNLKEKLNKGVYLVKMFSGENTSVQKIIIQ